MADLTYYVNTASVGGDGTTNNTTGATAAYASLNAFNTARVTNLTTDLDTVTVYCDGGADTANCDLSSWLTDNTYFLKIVPHANSVHTGVFDSGKYYKNTAGGNYDVAITDTGETTIIDGLQFNVTAGNSPNAVKVNATANATRKGVVANCIVKGPGSAGIGLRRVGQGTHHYYNNVVYDFAKGIESDGASTQVNTDCAIYNNTIENCTNGILLDIAGTNHYVKNNLIVNGTTCWQQDATPNATTATNITSDATSPDGASYQSKTITFTNLAGENYSTSDSDVVGAGTDLSTDSDGVLSFSTDILGRTREAWDVGAFENLYITSVSTDDTVGTAENPWSIVGTGFGTD